MTITTATLANELKVTQKTVRMAIKRGELRATRQRRGREQNTFVITRTDADDWKRRRAARAIGKVYPFDGETLPSRPPQHHAYFPNEDEDSFGEKVNRWMAAALQGCEQAKQSLRGMEQPLVRWYRAGIGEILP